MTSPSSAPKTQHQIEHLEDFTQHEWCNRILSDPSATKIMKRAMAPPYNSDVTNSFFAKTLFTDDAVRAFLSMYRPGSGRARRTADAQVAGDALLGDKEDNEQRSGTSPDGEGEEVVAPKGNDADDEPESLILVSLGTGVDGGKRRLHGGVIATLLDQVMGILISYLHENTSATAELNVKYKKAITTPCVVLCRARITREAGRWIETVGWIEDGGSGEVFAEGRGAFVKSKVNNGGTTGEKARI